MGLRCAQQRCSPNRAVADVYARLQNFGRHVQRRAAQGLRQALWLQRACKSKVRNLQHWATRAVGQQQVLRLQIALQGFARGRKGQISAL